MDTFATIELPDGTGPLVAAAVHNGHLIRPELTEIMALDEGERLREEDPFTGLWAAVSDARIIAHYSRFEVDLNRPRSKAVYLEPEDAWGLKVWTTQPPAEMLARSLASYDAFYGVVLRKLTEMQRRHERFVVFDLHTYNHRREGPDKPDADPGSNPEVNVGTGTMDRRHWASIVDRFKADLLAFDFLGRRLDVRENVRFKGGYFPRWIHENFRGRVCCLAIEVKKFFMDEWTGEPDDVQLEKVREALESTIPGVLEELKTLG